MRAGEAWQVGAPTTTGFPMKSRIVAHLGQTAILLPSLIAEALAANDRAKVRMSALQAAVERAGHPAAAPVDLSAECRAARIDATAVKSLIAGARAAAGGKIAAPGASRLIEALAEDVAAMVRAVEAGDPSETDLVRRFAAMKPEMVIKDDEFDRAAVAKLIMISSAETDSVHRLVMDLHKVLNRLAAMHAQENVAGAKTYGLTSDDKSAVAAFMRGVERTRALKFSHPGLDTLATRSDGKLLIQNDIGETDAHVLVVSVEATNVTLTYTDVHPVRAQFFVGLFDAFAVSWSGLDHERAEGLEAAAFYLMTGRFGAQTIEARDRFLEAVGGAIVFLID